MPNWITNKIQVAKEDLEKFKELAVTAEGAITFDKLLPMPKALDLDYYDVGDSDEELSTPVTYTNHAGEVVTLKTYKDMRRVYAENEKAYGAPSWYEWRIKNWGCKWDASECRRLSACTWRFETPWDAPQRWYAELAKHVPFKAIGADEGDIEPAFYFISDGAGKLSYKDIEMAEGRAVGLLMKYGSLAGDTLNEVAGYYDDKFTTRIDTCLKDPELIKKVAPELEDTDFFL